MIKIILLTTAVLVVCWGIYLFLTKPKTIEIGENKDTTDYIPDTSYIFMPVSLSLNGLLEGLNSRLPEKLIDREFKAGVGKIYVNARRNGDITSQLDSGYLLINLPFKFNLKYESATSETNPILTFVSSMPLEFINEIKLKIPLSVNQELNLTSAKEGMQINWDPLPQVEIPGMKFNLQAVIEKELLSEGGILYDYIIAQTLEKLSLKEYVNNAFEHFQLQIPVSDEDDGFFLRSEPISATLWYAGSNFDSLYVGLKIGSRFYVKHKSELVNAPILALPDHIGIENKGYFNDTSSFNIKVSLPLNVLNEITLKYLKETKLNYKGFKITIDRVRFTNGKNTVYVILRYTGNIEGELILKGTPHVNPETRIFTLKNIGIQSKSSNILIASADRVLNNYLVSKMTDAVTFDLGAAVDSLPKMFQSKLTELSFEQGVDTRIQQLKLDDIEMHLTRDKIQLIVKGRAKFFVTPRHYNFDFSKIFPE